MEGAQAGNEALAALLIEWGVLKEALADEILAEAKVGGQWLGEVVLDKALISAEELATIMSREMEIPLIDLGRRHPEGRALVRLRADLCRGRGVLPVAFNGERLTLAVVNPYDEDVLMTIRGLVCPNIQVFLAPMDILTAAVEALYPPADTIKLRPPTAKVGVVRGAAAVEPEAIEANLDGLLAILMANGGSDMHLIAGSPPIVRVNGQLHVLALDPLTPKVAQTLVYSALTDPQVRRFEEEMELDFAYSVPGLSRFRVNVHKQRGTVGSVWRTIPSVIPTLASLKMPDVVRQFTQRSRGLVLVTGPTGSGKSTTQAAMVDEINRTRRVHVVTIEDPIEFLHENQQSVIIQREVGTDTFSFSIALRQVLRQDPDVILIGEMRDLETTATALAAAETGHLVLATMHTTSAAQTIDRIVDMFPPSQQSQIRSQFASVLEGIISQGLIPRRDGHGLCCIQEIMVATPAVRTIIREDKVHQMGSTIQSGLRFGMQTYDQALQAAVHDQLITLEEAITRAVHPEDLRKAVRDSTTRIVAQ